MLVAIGTDRRDADAVEPSTRGWIIDIVVGGIAGGIIGAIVAVNVVIYSGIDDGYEATLGDVFAQYPVVGVIAVAILLLGPLAGIGIARFVRGRRRAAAPV